MDFVLAQKLFQLIGIEICQHFVTGHECRNVSLIGQFLHLLVGRTVLADIDLGKLITASSEISLGIYAPGTPFAAEKSDVGRHGGN